MASWRDADERDRMLRRIHALKQERSTLDPVYSDLALQFAPANGRFFGEMPNRRIRDYSHVIDSTGIEAIETSAAGLMSIASSPADRWIKYTSRDPDLDEFHTAKQWLEDAATVTLGVFADNNTYTALPGYYRELLTFATACGLYLPHREKVMCHYPMTCGEYWLQQNVEGEVNTFAREYHMTVAQMVKRFGLENCSDTVQGQFRNGDLDFYHHIAHLIEPREDRQPGDESRDGRLRDPQKLDGRNMPWRSVYWEMVNAGTKLLDDTGFLQFPVLAPRWDTVGGDAYGTGPGQRALPHSKRLQIMQKRLARGIHQQVDPATLWPGSMKNKEMDTNPGGKTFGDVGDARNGVRALHDYRLQLDHMDLSIQRVQNQVEQAFFAQFFAQVTNDERNQRATAREITAAKEESWLMLGPFAQRIFSELLSPMVQRTFERLIEEGAFDATIGPPPPELHGRIVSVKMVSPLAMAQEAVGAGADDRFVFQLLQIATAKPSVLHSFNEQEWATRYANRIGVDPKLVRPAEEVQRIIEAESRMQAAQQQAAMMESQSKAVKNLGTTPSAAAGDTALSDVGASMAGAGA